jgi:hypothetical protein
MDAAAFSPVHLATSYEMLKALLGHYFGIDPLYFYEVLGHVFVAFRFICLVLVLPNIGIESLSRSGRNAACSGISR